MKKLMMIGSSLLMLSSSVYATQARLLALGMDETDNEGVYHIADSRNIFLNPAYIHLFNNFGVLEWGSAGSGVPATGQTRATLNTDSSPKAQGGAFKKHGDMVYGLYFGNESNTSALLRIVGTGAASAAGAAANNGHMLQTADNQTDIFIGGDFGLKWAANLVYAKGEDASISSKDSAFSIRTGVLGSNWDAHANISLKSDSEMTDVATVGAAGINNASIRQEFEGKLGLHVGGSFLVNPSSRVFGYVKHYGWEQKDNFAYSAGQRAALGGQTGTVEGDFTSYYLGWGGEFDMSADGKVFTSLAAKRTDINLKFDNKSEVNRTIVPLTIGYEAKATEWLVLRGSVVQNIWGQRDNKNITGATSRLNGVAKQVVAGIYGGNGKATVANSTEVNAGASLTFGQLAIDGLIGTTGTAGAADSKTGVLSLENLETSVALTYKF